MGKQYGIAFSPSLFTREYAKATGFMSGHSTDPASSNSGRTRRRRLVGMFPLAAVTVALQGYPVRAQSETTLPPVTVSADAPAPDLLPEAYPGGQVATGSRVGMLGNKDFLDTPFNAISYTGQQIENSPTSTVMDTLALLSPSARTEWNSFGSSASQINLRGFNIQSTDVGYNGLYGVLPVSSISSDLAERIELLAGPNAFLNGMPPGGSLGGSVNVVPKHAGDTPLARVTTTYSSQSQAGGKVDLSRRFGDDNQFGVRFNGAYTEGSTAVDHNKNRLGLASLGLDYRGDRLRLSADLGYQNRQISGVEPYLYVPAGLDIPRAPKATHNFGPAWSRFENTDTFGVLHGEYDLTDKVTVHASVGGSNNRQRDLEAGRLSLTDNNGDIESTPWDSPARTKTVSAEAGINASLDTGPVNHALSLSGTQLRTRYWAYGTTYGDTVTSNLYNPADIPMPDFDTPSLPKVDTLKLSSLALGDTLSMLDSRLQFIVGGRLQRITEEDYDSTTGDVSSRYSKNAFSPSLGMVVKPRQNVSLYANYIQGLQSGTIVGTDYANAGQIFAPFKTKQYETGVKVDWGQFATTLSLYQITQPSTTTDQTANTLNVDGEQRNRGIEFNTFGEVSSGVRLLGGVSYIHAVLKKTQDGANDGKIAATVPQWQGNLGVEWDVPRIQDLTLTGRVIYTGWQYLDTDSPRRRIPAWTRVDVGARYLLKNALAKPVTLRLDVVNLANKSYWASGCCNSYVMEGEPRSLMLSASYDF